ncbi:MAG: hypothetical protein IPG04_18105 [Polyangiaceae bacterium]|nr:hypothetical protein [Polyangiaceae bacterium]
MLVSVLASLLTLSACSDDTTSPTGTGGGGEGGSPPQLEPVLDWVGYVDLPPTGAELEAIGEDGTARIATIVHAADDAASEAPLFVLFNGGPNAATSGGLLVYGIAPKTLDIAAPAAAPIDNPASWTRFGNLLFADARGAGFSYTLGQPETCRQSVWSDAADYLRVVLALMDSQPTLRGRRVIPVGESYGGARAAALVYLAHHYAELPQAIIDDVGPTFQAELQAHVDAAGLAAAGGAATPDEMAAQFGEMVLIQPAFSEEQRDFTTRAPSDYDTSSPIEEEQAIVDGILAHLFAPGGLEPLLGASPASIDGLRAETRPAGSYRIFNELDTEEVVAAREAALRAALGEPSPGDAYWLFLNYACSAGFDWLATEPALFDVLPRTRVLMTNAQYDNVVVPELLPTYWQTLGASAILDDAPRDGEERPGWMLVTTPEGEEVEIRFPSYDAGHSVAMKEAAGFADDVEAWLAEGQP